VTPKPYIIRYTSPNKKIGNKRNSWYCEAPSIYYTKIEMSNKTKAKYPDKIIVGMHVIGKPW